MMKFILVIVVLVFQILGEKKIVMNNHSLLKVESFDQKLYGVNIEFDEYTPLSITLSLQNNTHPSLGKPNLFWRGGDLKHSLIEVSFDFLAGNLKGIDIVLLQNIKKINSDDELIKYSLTKKGLPIVNTRKWPAIQKQSQHEFSQYKSSDYIINSNNHYFAYLSGNELIILFDDSRIFPYSSKSENLIYLISEDFVLGGIILKISEDEKNKFKKLWVKEE